MIYIKMYELLWIAGLALTAGFYAGMWFESFRRKGNKSL